MLEKEFIPYQEALALKELGFDEPCFGWFTFGHLRKGTIVENKHVQGEGELLAPTYSQAFRWFREKHNLHVNKTGNNFYTSFNIVEPDMVVLSFKRYTDTENHYEEAELECLNKLIELVKNK